MALQHDQDGFLVGDTTQLNEQVELLESISKDIKAIRSALNGLSVNAVDALPNQQTPVAGTAQNTVTNNTPNNTVINQYAGAVSNVNQSHKIENQTGDSYVNENNAQSDRVTVNQLSSSERRKLAASRRLRDSKGRFIAGNQPGSQTATVESVARLRADDTERTLPVGNAARGLASNRVSSQTANFSESVNNQAELSTTRVNQANKAGDQSTTALTQTLERISHVVENFGGSQNQHTSASLQANQANQNATLNVGEQSSTVRHSDSAIDSNPNTQNSNTSNQSEQNRTAQLENRLDNVNNTLVNQVSNNPSNSTNAPEPEPAETTRDQRGRFTAQQNHQAPAVVEPRQRDSRGRFISADTPGGEAGFISRLASGISKHVKSTVDVGVDDRIDPMITASKELVDTVRPVMTAGRFALKATVGGIKTIAGVVKNHRNNQADTTPVLPVVDSSIINQSNSSNHTQSNNQNSSNTSTSSTNAEPVSQNPTPARQRGERQQRLSNRPDPATVNVTGDNSSLLSNNTNQETPPNNATLSQSSESVNQVDATRNQNNSVSESNLDPVLDINERIDSPTHTITTGTASYSATAQHDRAVNHAGHVLSEANAARSIENNNPTVTNQARYDTTSANTSSQSLNHALSAPIVIDQRSLTTGINTQVPVPVIVVDNQSVEANQSINTGDYLARHEVVSPHRHDTQNVNVASDTLGTSSPSQEANQSTQTVNPSATVNNRAAQSSQNQLETHNNYTENDLATVNSARTELSTPSFNPSGDSFAQSFNDTRTLIHPSSETTVNEHPAATEHHELNTGLSTNHYENNPTLSNALTNDSAQQTIDTRANHTEYTASDTGTHQNSSITDNVSNVDAVTTQTPNETIVNTPSVVIESSSTVLESANPTPAIDSLTVDLPTTTVRHGAIQLNSTENNAQTTAEPISNNSDNSTISVKNQSENNAQTINQLQDTATNAPVNVSATTENTAQLNPSTINISNLASEQAAQTVNSAPVSVVNSANYHDNNHQNTVDVNTPNTSNTQEATLQNAVNATHSNHSTRNNSTVTLANSEENNALTQSTENQTIPLSPKRLRDERGRFVSQRLVQTSDQPIVEPTRNQINGKPVSLPAEPQPERAQTSERGFAPLVNRTSEAKESKKFFREFSSYRKEQSAFDKAAKKSLKDISDKEVTPSESSNNGVMTGLMAGLLPAMMSLLASLGASIVAVFSGLGGLLLSGITGVLGVIFSPIALGIAAAASLAWGLFTEDGQKFFAGIGQWLTDKFNGAIELFATTFPETTQAIKDSWDAAISVFSETWKAVTDKADKVFSWFSETWKSITDTVSGIFDRFSTFLKDKFGIDIPKIVNDVVQPIADSASTVIKPVTDAAASVINGAKDLGDKAVSSIKEAVVNVKDNPINKAYERVKSSVKNGTVLQDVTTSVQQASNKAGEYASSAITGTRGNEKLAMKVLMDKGWTKEQAAGIAANLHAESGFDTQALGDNGKARGIGQWHPDRQKKFEQVYGKRLENATFEDQVGFVDWELKHTEKAAGAKIAGAKTAKEAAALTEQKYERSAVGLKGGVQAERVANAEKFAQLDDKTIQGSSNLGSKAVEHAKYIGGDIVEGVKNFNNRLVEGTQNAMDKGVKYLYGSKNSATGAIDCSGWVTELNNQVYNEMGKPDVIKQAMQAINKGATQGGAAGIIKSVGEITGKELSGNEVNIDNLKEGMMIGIDHSQSGSKSGEGRYKGIDHITQVVKNPETGAMQISESSSKKGVHLTDAKEWLERNKNKAKYAVDPYQAARDDNGELLKVNSALASVANTVTQTVEKLSPISTASANETPYQQTKTSLPAQQNKTTVTELVSQQAAPQSLFEMAGQAIKPITFNVASSDSANTSTHEPITAQHTVENNATSIHNQTANVNPSLENYAKSGIFNQTVSNQSSSTDPFFQVEAANKANVNNQTVSNQSSSTDPFFQVEAANKANVNNQTVSNQSSSTDPFFQVEAANKANVNDQTVSNQSSSTDPFFQVEAANKANVNNQTVSNQSSSTDPFFQVEAANKANVNNQTVSNQSSSTDPFFQVEAANKANVNNQTVSNQSSSTLTKITPTVSPKSDIAATLAKQTANNSLSRLLNTDSPINIASAISALPKMPTIPAISDAPAVSMPAHMPNKEPITVTMPNADVGQNLSDNRLAHIVSGGYARLQN